MKALRIVLAVVGGIILIVVIAAIILINTFDPNSLKDNLQTFVEERTGRRLNIEQDIELSLFPWFAVQTGGISLSDDPAFGQRDFVRIESMSARVRVWPLLRRQVEIGRVALDGIELNLGVDAAGRGNWSTLLPPDDPGAPVLPAPDEEDAGFDQLVAEGVEISNARIQWHGANGEVRYIARDLSLSTGVVRDDEPVDLSLSLSLFDVASEMTAVLNLDATAARAPASALREADVEIQVLDAAGMQSVAATISLDEAVFGEGRLRSGPIELTASLTDSPFGDAALELAAALAGLVLDTNSETLTIEGLTLNAGGIDARLDLSGTGLLSTPQLRGEIQASGANIAALFEALGAATPPELAGADAGGFSVDAGLAVGLSPLAVTIDRYTLNALGVEARGSGARNAAGDVTARIEVPTFRPNEPMKRLASARLPPGTDLNALTSISFLADASMTAGSGRLELSGIDLALNRARLGGRLILTGIADPARIQGQIDASGIDNALLGALLGHQLPPDLLATDVGELRLTTAFDYSRTTGRAIFDPLGIAAYGISGEGRLTIETSGPLELLGQARLAPFSPRELLTRFGLPVPASSDPRAFSRAELAASFQTTGSSGSFRDIALTLDDSRITGEFSVENFADPTYRFVLRADRIDADRYLPPKGDAPAAAAATAADPKAPAGAATPAGVPAERRLGDIRLDGDALTATRVAGSASVGDLTIGGMRFRQLSADLAVGDGRAALRSVQTELYGGTFTGGMEIDATGATPSAHLRGTASALAMDPLFVDMLGASAVSGSGNFDLDLTGRGATIGEAVATSAGTMSVSFSDGELRGINLGHGLCKAMNAFGQVPEPPPAPDATPYRVIRASATVASGTASTQDLFVSTGYAELTGQGSLRLADQVLDTSYVARMVGPVNLPGCERLNSRIDGSIPIGFSLEGPVSSPTPAFDVRQLAEDLARREIRNQVEDTVRDRIQDALRGAFE